MQIDITGDNSTVETAAAVESTRKPDLDFSVPTEAATAASAISSQTPDLDFVDDNEFTITLNVDGGSDQTITLDEVYEDIDELVEVLNDQTEGATWSVSDNGLYLVIASNTTGGSSEIEYAHDTDGATDLFIDDDDYFGEEAAQALNLQITVDGGSVQNLYLSEKFPNLDELIEFLNDNLTGATARTSTDSAKSEILVIESDTTGEDSEILIASDGSKSVYIEDQDIFGTESTVTGNTLIVHSETGSAANPTVVTIQNVGPDSEDPFTGPVLEVSRDDDLTFGTGIQIYAGSAASFQLISGDNLYATASNGETVDTRTDIAGA